MWTPVSGTNNWQYLEEESNMILRHVAARAPYIGEPDGTEYEITGEGHEHSIHNSPPEAMAAAQASLAS